MKYRLRKWEDTDVESLIKYANNVNIASRLTNRFPHPYTEKDAQAFIAFANNISPVTIFAIDVNGEACGGIGLHPLNDVWHKNAELGYWLAEHLWGKGIITQAIAEVVQIGFKELEINRIFARPFGSNHASQRVLEKNGFVLEARLLKTIFKNEKFEDELIYAIRKHM